MSAGLGSSALWNSRKSAGISGLNSHPDPARVILYWTPSAPAVVPTSLLPGCSPGQIPFDSTSTVEPSEPTLATVPIEEKPASPTLLPTGDPFFNAGETISYARHSGSCIENGTSVTGFTSLSPRTRSLEHTPANAEPPKSTGEPTNTPAATTTRANIKREILINTLPLHNTSHTPSKTHHTLRASGATINSQPRPHLIDN